MHPANKENTVAPNAYSNHFHEFQQNLNEGVLTKPKCNFVITKIMRNFSHTVKRHYFTLRNKILQMDNYLQLLQN